MERVTVVRGASGLALVGAAGFALALALFVGGADGALHRLDRVQPPGVEPNGAITDISMSDDGSCMVGSTTATNVPTVGGSTVDSNGATRDIVLYDIDSTSLVRITDSAFISSFDPTVDDDCSHIAFNTLVTVPTPLNSVVVYTVATRSSTTVATDAILPVISGNGGFVFYMDNSTGKLVRKSADGTGGTTEVSVGAVGSANSTSFQLSPSDDGTRVAFTSFATNLVVGPQNSLQNVYLRDITAGTTTLVSSTSSGGMPSNPGGVNGSSSPTLSGDGRFITFASDLPDVTGTTGRVLVLRDLATSTNTVVAQTSAFADVDESGNIVFVTSESRDPADTNTDNDVYLRLNDGTFEWLSRPAGGGAPSGGVSPFVGTPVLAEGGGIAAFTSARTNLVAGDGNGLEDAFVVALAGGTPTTSSTMSTSAPASTMTTAASIPTTTTAVDFAPRPVIDLVVRKTASKPAHGNAYAPGETITYTVEVVNAGTVEARNVHIRDTLEVGDDLGGDTDAQLTTNAPGCTAADAAVASPSGIVARELDCPLGAIPPAGGRASVTYTAKVAARNPVDLINRAEASATANDADPKDNVADVHLMIDAKAAARACGAGESCAPGGDGDERFDCSGTVCGGGPGSDTLVCGGGAVCSGGLDDDRYICTGDGTACSGGVGDDTGTCLRDAECKEDVGDDVLSCVRADACDSGGGDDTILCRLGACEAGSGDDTVNCDRSTCQAGKGNDRLYGRAGREIMVAGKGKDTVNAGPGNDVVDVADGEPDSVDCGPGKDTVFVDVDDDVAKDCENVLGADVAVTAEIGSSKPGGFGSRHVRVAITNRGPGRAHGVRVRINVTVTGTDRSRMGEVTQGVGACSTTSRARPDRDVYTVTCSAEVVSVGSTHYVSFEIDAERNGAWVRVEAEVEAAEPDYSPGNNRVTAGAAIWH